MRRMRYRSLSRAEKFNLLPLPYFANSLPECAKRGQAPQGINIVKETDI